MNDFPPILEELIIAPFCRKMAHRIQRAFAYLRTSSAANVGSDKDSERRQRQTIEAFATRAGYELVAEFYDAAVSGADPIEVSGYYAWSKRSPRRVAPGMTRC
jgi:Resolvase, N terminal domain